MGHLEEGSRDTTEFPIPRAWLKTSYRNPKSRMQCYLGRQPQAECYGKQAGISDRRDGLKMIDIMRDGENFIRILMDDGCRV